MSNEIVSLDEDNFSSYVKSNDGYILIFKRLCPNCKIMRKVLDKCQNQKPEIKLAEIDIEDKPSFLKRLNITKVPTVLVIKAGDIVTRCTGLVKPTEMLSLLVDS